MADPVRVLGFDPGLYVPAFAELDMKGKLLRVEAVNDKKAIDANIDPAWRAHHIATVIIRAVVAHGVRGCYVVGIEGPAYGYTKSAAMDQLARCRQALYDACATHLDDMIYFSVAPATRITSLGLSANKPGGRNKGGKHRIVEQVQRVFRVTLNTKNTLIREGEADAIAVANAALGLYRRKVVIK